VEPITIQEILDWTGAVPDRPVDAGQIVTEISKNTKTLKPGAVFVPLKGEKFDGHDFIDAAVSAGAAAVFCSRREQNVSVPRLMVDNTLLAAQRLAAGYRRKLAPRVVGVTGSVGKTTTSSMIAAVLAKRWELARTQPDMNGQIGLTFDMFNLKPSQRVAVWEMGMSLPGELTRLSNMAQPDIALINSIGTAHIEFFGTRERIREAKLEILAGMPEDGVLILNGDEPLLWELRGTLGKKTCYYALHNPEADLCGEILQSDSAGQRLQVRGCGRELEVYLPAIGEHNVQNALGALLCGILMELTDEELRTGIADFETPEGRQHIVEHHGVVVMEDCYNASPDAVKASMKVLSNLGTGRRYAALGGMRELGAYAPEAHRACGAAAAAVVSELWLYGEGAEDYRRGAMEAGMREENVHICTEHEQIAREMANVVKSGDAVIFKGSRLMNMERAMKRFYELT